MHANNTRYSREEELSQIKAAKLDPSFFAPLYEVYYKPIFIFIHHRLRDKEQTADLTAQVFLKAMLNIKKYEDRGYPFSAWLYRIAFNEMNMFHRRNKKETDVEVNESDAMEIMDGMNERYSEENCLLILDALSEMPEEISNLVELRFMQKLSFQEIGAIFGITEANAKMKLYRALEKLKVLYEKKAKDKE
jgi:RNA polymerase sigma-70 factor, ECF subfamily